VYNSPLPSTGEGASWGSARSVILTEISHLRSRVPGDHELPGSRVVTSLPSTLATLLARMWGAGRSRAPWIKGGHEPPLDPGTPA